MIQVPVGAKLIIDNTADTVGNVIAESNDEGEKPIIEGFDIRAIEGEPITFWEQGPEVPQLPHNIMELSFQVPNDVSPEVAAMIVLGKLEDFTHEYGATQAEDGAIIERMATWWLARSRSMQAE